MGDEGVGMKRLREHVKWPGPLTLAWSSLCGPVLESPVDPGSAAPSSH